MSHPLVVLARQALEETLVHGRRFEAPPALTAQFATPTAVFVTLRSPTGELRGCIGSVTPITDSLAAEVIMESIAAATRDPRFDPVEPEEVPELQIEVSVLSEPEPVASLNDLDPSRYGVIVTSVGGGRRGLLLPNIEGIQTAAQQVRLARHKASIGEIEDVRLFRFRADKYQ